MSQNPFDQQQNPFGQQPPQQQQNPFGQQPQSNWGSGPTNFQQPMQPQKSGGGAVKCLLIGIGVVVLCCVVSCVGLIGLAYVAGVNNAESLIAFAWAGQVGTGDFSSSTCPASQAERFSYDFEKDYTGFTPEDVNTSDNAVTMTGSAQKQIGGSETITLTMTINPDEGELSSLGIGCIATIRQN